MEQKHVIVDKRKKYAVTKKYRDANKANMLIFGSFLAISFVILQAISSTVKNGLDLASIILFAIAIPLLAGCFMNCMMENSSGFYYKKWVLLNNLFGTVGALCFYAAMVLYFWELSLAAGILFLCASFFMFVFFSLNGNLQVSS